MNTELPTQRRRKFNPSPSVILPDDLIVEILCFLKVKPLMKMKCVSKSWKTLISDPKFVKKHLNQSSQNSHFYAASSKRKGDYRFLTFSGNDLLENRRINLPSDPYYSLIDKDCREVVGSYNGLVCLLGSSLSKEDNDEHKEKWLRIWNPATRTISDKLEYFCDNKHKFCKFMFGYDNTTDTYKVVALHLSNDMTTEVQILRFGDNIWRNIGSFTGRSLQSFFSKYGCYGGVHLNCTVNWLAMKAKNGDRAVQFVIISLDLTTETHTDLLPPPVFPRDASLLQQEGVCVLMNSLCFYHDFKGTDFVIWKMTKFGDGNSWTQFLKLSYQNFPINYGNLFEYGDTLVITDSLVDRAILYNWRNNRVVKTSVDKNIGWLSINNYVESLVSTC